MTTTAAAPSIPREEWEAHPRFRSQALLLGSHANFRRVSRYLIEKATREELVGLHALFDRWIGAMRSHEAYEEGKLYPYLEHRWGVSLDSARAGHEALHARANAVVAAFESGARPAGSVEHGEDEADQPVLRALRAHDQALVSHLDVEEEAVIPLLLALEPGEFVRYYDSPISLLVPRGR
jgi:hypothetical protein